jgi:hypothetical protein
MYTSMIFILLVVVVNISAAPLFPSVSVSMDHFEVLRIRASETVSKISCSVKEGIWAARPNPISDAYGTSVLKQ